MAGFCRVWIANFSTLALYLSTQGKEADPFQWEKEQQEAFNKAQTLNWID